EALRSGRPAPIVSVRLHRKVARCMQLAGENKQAVEWYRKGLAILDDNVVVEEEDPRERAALCGGLGWVLGYLMGENDEGLRLSETAVQLLEGTRYRRELAQALSRLG